MPQKRSLTLLLAVLGSTSCDPGDPPTFASARVMETKADGVGGPKAIAEPGDIVLENEHLRVAILGAKNSLGPGIRGGSLIDADLARPEPQYQGGHGRDQLAELFPTVNMVVSNTDPAALGSVEIAADGSDGKAIVRVRGPGLPFLGLLDVLYSVVNAPEIWLETDYIAEAGKPWLTLSTRAAYGYAGTGELAADEPMGGSTEGMPLITWAIESGVVAGDFYLQGGSVDVFAPGIGFDEDGAVYRMGQEQKNTFLEPFRFPFLAGVADGVSYGLAPADGDMYVPLFTASQTLGVGAGREGDGTSGRFAPGSVLSYDRYFFVGHGDIGSIVDQLVDAKGMSHGTVAGFVTETTTGRPVSGIDVFVYEPGAEFPWSQWESDIDPLDGADDGSFGGSLPTGDWELLVHDRSRPPGDRVPIHVEADGHVDVGMVVGRTGALHFAVTDEVGRRVPSKITLFRQDQAPVADPALGDGFIGGSPDAVLFSIAGEGEVDLAPGTYVAVASRGIEYEIDESAPFTVNAGSGARIDLVVTRSVDTEGWISADLHVHSNPSHDSGVQLVDRVLTMVAEGVEFFVATDHDYVTDFAPVVEELGLEQWVQTAIGNEVTTIEIGHFLGFPLAHDFQGEAGATREDMDWTGRTPTQNLDALRDMGARAGFDPVVFVGHPRDGILGYFDQYGLDPFAGTPGIGGAPGTVVIETPLLSSPTLSDMNALLSPAFFDLDFDGLELLNGKRFEILRTATQPEMDDVAAGGETDVYDLMSRTLAEQDDLERGLYKLGYGWEGHIDDWFALTNLGFKYTVLGNSDTHGFTSVEAGCPRNFILSDTDDPALLDDQAVADAVKAHQVVASYGPFVQFTADNGGGPQPIGSELTGIGPVELLIDVQAPSWIAVDRLEIYENGTLIQEVALDEAGAVDKGRYKLTVTPERDSWYVVIAMGDDDLGPLFTPVEIPYVELQVVVSEALGGVPSVASLVPQAIPIPKEFPTRPFAITNPIWIDLAGDGFDAPGLPAWWVAAEPVAP